MTETVGIQLNIITKGRVTDAPDAVVAKRKADRENGRQQAQEYAKDALLATVAIMHTSKDPSVVLKAAKMIMDRAWGIPKSAEEEEANAKNQSIIEILAAFSSGSTHVEQQRVPALEHTTQTMITGGPSIDDLNALLIDAEPDDA